ncbi:MAG: nucleotidyltransferase domain-containing protein [Burkholderiales bacterium]|nr:nucleotidyltransferase domain-containing protein [Burkholderiales bacterium]
MLKARFAGLLDDVLAACLAVYGARLASLAVFGSVARATMRPDSDIDLLLVAETLPAGRMARMDEFAAVEARVAPALRAAAAAAGIQTILSPVFKTPEELRRGGFLFLDLVEEARILYDRDGLLRGYLDELGRRLAAMGAKRVRKGGGYYWVVKPDYRPGDTIEL